MQRQTKSNLPHLILPISQERQTTSSSFLPSFLHLHFTLPLASKLDDCVIRFGAKLQSVILLDKLEQERGRSLGGTC